MIIDKFENTYKYNQPLQMNQISEIYIYIKQTKKKYTHTHTHTESFIEPYYILVKTNLRGFLCFIFIFLNKEGEQYLFTHKPFSLFQLLLL